ncbi:MAG: 3-hydroxyacyl-CoA dehydrogenase, partial [Deltaproteobacteria bacterium]
MDVFRYEKDDRGIVTLTLDMPGRSANVIDETFGAGFREVLERLRKEANLSGVILTSGKELFLAGADLDGLYPIRDPAVIFERAEALKSAFRELETLGKPVVAALNGTALGGGMELALACHHRIALDHPKSRFGFPEVSLGLLPGGGGITRLVRMVGLMPAFPILMEGTRFTPREALDRGLIDELAETPEEMFEKARAWITAHPAPKKGWDEKGFEIPGGSPANREIAKMLAVGPAMLRKKTRGNYPAPHAIMAAAVEGAQVDFDTACRIESRYMAKLATGQVSKNMMTAFWYHLNEIEKGGNRPKGIPPQETRKVGVLGAGMMGHGIAYVSAYAGMAVVLKDLSREAAQKG